MDLFLKYSSLPTAVARLGAGAALAAVCAFAAAQPAAVPTAPVQSQSGRGSYALDGVIEAVKQSTVAAQTSGRVTALLVKAGDPVHAGQLLLTIDDREVQAGVQRAQAQVAQADADLRNAKAQFERTRDLQAKGFVSPAALDTAQAQYQSAQAVHAQALAGAHQSGLVAAYARVVAPYDGWVLQTQVQAGDLASPGLPLLVMYAPQPLRAVVQVPASRNALVRQARQTQIEVEGAAVSPITPLRRLQIPSSDPVAQTTQWRFDLAPRDAAGLVPGQQVRAVFESAGEAPAAQLSVPLAAVVRRGELSAVYVRVGAAFALRAVRLGNPVGSDRVEVLAGLSPDAVVALDPLRAAAQGAK